MFQRHLLQQMQGSTEEQAIRLGPHPAVGQFVHPMQQPFPALGLAAAQGEVAQREVARRGPRDLPLPRRAAAQTAQKTYVVRSRPMVSTSSTSRSTSLRSVRGLM